MNTPLCDLALKWGTDKAGSHEYTEFYYDLFKDKREGVKKVLEIGIGRPESMWKGYRTGASLYMWQEFFHNAEIYALDIVKEILINEGRIHSFYCDQSNEESLKEALRLVGNDFDLILDDGSHVPRHQILTAQILSPALSKDGVYIIEDLVGIEPNVIVDEISKDFTCQVKVCPSRRGQEKVVVIRHA